MRACVILLHIDMACASLGCVLCHLHSLIMVCCWQRYQPLLPTSGRCWSKSCSVWCRVCGRSELSVADAVDVFDKILASSSPPAKPAVWPAPPGSTAPADGTNSCNCNGSSSSRPTGLSHVQRQSTFMRCVTQQLLQRLEAGAQGAAAALEAGAEDSSAGAPADPTASTAASSHPSASAAVNSAPTAPPGAAAGSEGSMMTCTQFLQAMVQLSRRCFLRIANGTRAWRLLLERHIQPLADRKRGR